MKRIALLLASLAFAGAAHAQDLPEVIDGDANGTWSLVELQSIWPELAEDAFTAIDTNLDGEVDQIELQTAWENAVLTAPATDG